VLLDIRLPGLDGYEVCRQLKQDPATRDIPVIFVSALDEGMDKVRGFELGGNDYIPKPFQAVEVVARVENQLKIANLQREMALKNAELERANRMLQSLSYLDPLTGIANRRNFDESFEQEWRRARREDGRVALVMADVDRFKDYNDLYGHPSGDECLRRVALEASNSLRRAGDLAARYGGEEFALVLPGTDTQGARIVAEDVRARVERLQIPHKGSPHGVVTLSLGVAAMSPKDDQPRELLVAAADRALYQAKANGRNRLEMETV
jgi:diguanylate cyclase (GGDEF)-like protein